MAQYTADSPNSVITGTDDSDIVTLLPGSSGTSVTTLRGNDVVRGGADEIDPANAYWNTTGYDISTGANKDKIALIDAVSSDIDSGEGDDRIWLGGISDAMEIDAGGGDDHVTLRSYTVNVTNPDGSVEEIYSSASETRVDLGAGNDYADLAMTASTGVGFGVHAGEGDDTVRLRLNELQEGLLDDSQRVVHVYMGEGDNLLDARFGAGNGATGRMFARAEGGNDTMYGGRGNDTIQGRDGDDLIYGMNGDDTLDGGADNDELHGGNGSDLIWGGTGQNTLHGGRGNDSLHGHSGHDVMHGGHGGDYFSSQGGNDTLDGGAGDDRLEAGHGDDEVSGGIGNDTLFGEFGNDTLKGGNGDDLFDAGDGDDWLTGGAGADTMQAGDGADKVLGGAGHDEMFGEADSDYMSGGTGNDLLDGGSGHDRLVGGEGADTFVGGTGNDLFLMDGDDAMATGGAGRDTFRIDLAEGLNNDITITDFETTDAPFVSVADRLILKDIPDDEVLSFLFGEGDGDDLLISGNNGSILVEDQDEEDDFWADFQAGLGL